MDPKKDSLEIISLEGAKLDEEKVISYNSEKNLYKGLTLIEEESFQGYTSIKYWM